MLAITVHDGRVFVGDRFSVSFQRTRRAGDESLKYPPVSRGHLPAHLLTGPAPHPCPPMSADSHVLIPCGYAESVWLGFAGAGSRPVALKIFAGPTNAITGGPRDDALHGDPQDYVVAPDQTSWHGVRSDAAVRQFSGEPIELVVYEPVVPIDRARDGPRWDAIYHAKDDMSGEPGRLDPFAIVPDPYGLASWSNQPSGRVTIACVDDGCWRSITGEDPPAPRSEYQGWRLP